MTIYAMVFSGPDGPLIYVGGTGNLPLRADRHRDAMTTGTHPNRLVRAAYRACGLPTFVPLEVADLNTPDEAAALESQHLLTLCEEDSYRVLNLKRPAADDYAATFPIDWTPVDDGRP